MHFIDHKETKCIPVVLQSQTKVTSTTSECSLKHPFNYLYFTQTESQLKLTEYTKFVCRYLRVT